MVLHVASPVQSSPWRQRLGLFLASLMGLALVSCEKSGPDLIEPVAAIQDGEVAPNLAFVDLNTGQTRRLADYRGKTLLLEFWASWCVNCQKTMPKFQEIATNHPEWEERVEIIAISIDDLQSAATAHVERKQWNQTQQAWADPMKGGNSDLLPYVIEGIPMACVIDSEGILRGRGHPNRLDAESIINDLLTDEARTRALEVRPSE